MKTKQSAMNNRIIAYFLSINLELPLWIHQRATQLQGVLVLIDIVLTPLGQALSMAAMSRTSGFFHGSLASILLLGDCIRGWHVIAFLRFLHVLLPATFCSDGDCFV